MGVSISAENIMACMLMEVLKKGKNSIPFEIMYRYGRELQEKFNDKDMNINVANHSYIKFIDVNPLYFEYLSINSTPWVRAVKGANYTDKMPNDKAISDLMVDLVVDFSNRGLV